ncbi:pentatricopeptide repeat-containing protein At1g07740, mitochondrial isoform X1 [Solanum stenotomum]|uniref:pentatricopeptide repeat-containing protein At1g07740, mitochondrial isoform X1 n=1 Tax=Solanum stenotomum TaxID=172797 RepID=UPI0020D1A8AA|nr:pentatricopeptide repeat-containing protein At1g07740, mitochondrial isoform X1 [Solanum stenotomum]
MINSRVKPATITLSTLIIHNLAQFRIPIFQSQPYHSHHRTHRHTSKSSPEPHKPTRNLLRKPIPLLADLKQIQDPDEAISLFHDYQQMGFKHDYPTYSCLVYKLAKSRNFEAVESLLGYLQTHYIRCKETLFIGLIQHYGKAQLVDKAVELFHKMGSFNCSRSVQSFNAILNVFVDNGRSESANEMLRSCSKMGIWLNSVSFNIIIKMWLEKGDWEMARQLFDEMLEREVEPTVVTYNCQIGFLCKKGDVEGAKSLFQDMVKKGKKANAVSYALLMEGLCSLGRYKEAKKLMFDMEYQGCKLKIVNYGVLMTDLLKRGEIGEANSLLVEMKKRRVKPDIVIYNMLINYFCKEGKTAEAYRMLVDMQIAGCYPIAITYRMVVDGFCKTGEFEEGLKVLNAMLMSRHFPRMETVRCLILGLLDKGKVEDACFVLEEMEKRKKKFNFDSWEVIVKDSCTSDRSHRVHLRIISRRVFLLGTKKVLSIEAFLL